MARTPMVTRTFQTTEACVLCLNIQTGASEKHTVTLSGLFKDDKSTLKAARKVVETETLKAVHVISTVLKEDLYGMSEQDFIANAKILPPRGKKTEDESEG